jgi:hypothetical protein
MTAPSPARQGRVGKPILAGLALIAAAYGIGAYGLTAIRERGYFLQHALMKARALSIPRQLTVTESEIRSEQRRILAAQAAIQAASR